MTVYLASPYNSDDPIVRENRFLDVSLALAMLFNKGYHVYSVIAMTHTAANIENMPKNYEFWHEFNCTMIDKMDELWVLCLPGWHVSQGIRAEVLYAISKGKFIRFWDLNENTILERTLEAEECFPVS